jgi:HD-GYP domain-containing protein (c-di-GMP phosphodiesterase class II)
MKKANKRPSEWLKLLCKDWAEAGENIELIETMDSKFESYKPYLKGKLSSQLLCRLCIPSETGSSAKDASTANSGGNSGTSPNSNNGGSSTKPDFLQTVLNIRDDFDKAYVIAQIERFCALYDIRGIQQQAEAASASTGSNSSGNNNAGRFSIPTHEATAAAAAALYGDLVETAALQQQAIAAAAATATAAPWSADATAAAVAAAQQAAVAASTEGHKGGRSTSGEQGASTSVATQQVAFANSSSAQALLTKTQQRAKSAERALEHERKQNAKREQKRLSQDKKLAKQRDREFLQKQKKAEKLAREMAREEKRNHKLLQRQQRERFAQEQKEAALRRAAELVASNRVPIEITRAGAFRSRNRNKQPPPPLPGMVAAKEAAAEPGVNVSKRAAPEIASKVPKKRRRSAIVVSTASDLDRIVTHSQNLWAKYNAIAKEHNQRVNWITVAKELGIHVKVREKYARMHSRACQRNFDFVRNGYWKIKDHPEIFQEPTPAEQKARMPPPLPPSIDATTIATTEAVGMETDGDAAAKITDATEGSDQGGDSLQQAPAPPEQEPVKKDVTTVSVAEPVAVATDPPVPAATHHLGIPNSVDAAAAAATAAAVVDAAGVGGATIDMHHVVELTAATATTVADGGSANENRAVAVATSAGGGATSEPVAFEL